MRFIKPRTWIVSSNDVAWHIVPEQLNGGLCFLGRNQRPFHEKSVPFELIDFLVTHRGIGSSCRELSVVKVLNGVQHGPFVCFRFAVAGCPDSVHVPLIGDKNRVDDYAVSQGRGNSAEA